MRSSVVRFFTREVYLIMVPKPSRSKPPRISVGIRPRAARVAAPIIVFFRIEVYIRLCVKLGLLEPLVFSVDMLILLVEEELYRKQ